MVTIKKERGEWRCIGRKKGLIFRENMYLNRFPSWVWPESRPVRETGRGLSHLTTSPLPAKQEGGALYQHMPDKQTGRSTVMRTDEWCNAFSTWGNEIRCRQRRHGQIPPQTGLQRVTFCIICHVDVGATFCTICKFQFLCLFFFFLLKLHRAWLDLTEFSIICGVQQVAWDKHFTGNNLAEDLKSPVSAAILKICNVHSIIHNTEPAFIRAADLRLKLLCRSAAGTSKLIVCTSCALHLFHAATVCSLFSAAREHYVWAVVSYRTLQQVKIQIDAIYREACINTTRAVRGEQSMRQSAWGHSSRGTQATTVGRWHSCHIWKKKKTQADFFFLILSLLFKSLSFLLSPSQRTETQKQKYIQVGEKCHFLYFKPNLAKINQKGQSRGSSNVLLWCCSVIEKNPLRNFTRLFPWLCSVPDDQQRRTERGHSGGLSVGGNLQDSQSEYLSIQCPFRAFHLRHGNAHRWMQLCARIWSEVFRDHV